MDYKTADLRTSSVVGMIRIVHFGRPCAFPAAVVVDVVVDVVACVRGRVVPA